MNRRPVLAIAAAFFCLLCAGARAEGPARLVHDFFPDEFEGGSPVSQLTPLGPELFFVADDLDSGPGVWRTDGTPAGTERVPVPGLDETREATIAGRLGDRVLWLETRDAEPDVQVLAAAAGTGDGVVLRSYKTRGLLQVLRSRAYFQDCGGAGCVLWSTDGTPAGTRPVRALAPFRAADQAILATVADQWLVFRSREKLLAYDAARNRVLTLMASGARKIQVYPAGQTLYAITRYAKWRLWASRLESPRAVSLLSSSYINIMGRLGDSLYFATGDGKLWTTEGRPGSTRAFPGSPVDPFSRLSDELGAIGTKVFLPDPGYYWGGLLQVDPAARKVKTLYTLCSGKYDCLSSSMSNVTVVGKQGFLAIDGRLFESDGTRAGTRPHPVLDQTDASTFRVLGDRLLLGATSRDGEQQLWETDGTAKGTRSLTDGTLDRPFTVESAPVSFAGAILVAADQKPVGHQLWRVENGHAEALTNLRHLPSGVRPFFATIVGDRIVLRGEETDGWVAVAGDGSVEALPVEFEGCSLYEVPCPRERVLVGKRLVFSPYPGVNLWSTDGTAAGTGALPMSAQLVALGQWRGEALAAGYDGTLWASDGTAAGTRVVARIPVDPYLERYPVGPPLPAGPLVYLFRRVLPDDPAGDASLELWRTDGTEEGTLRLVSIPFPRLNHPYADPVVVGGRLFFRFFGVLWTSDGSIDGTQPIPQQPSGGTFALETGGSVLYAGSGTVDSGEQHLWAIDPATLEPTLLMTAAWIGRGAVGFPLGSLVGSTLLFQAREDQGIVRWWVTEGTPASTHPVGQPPGDLTSPDLVTAGNRRWFTACEPEHGCELWSTDRLGEDTRLVQDLWPGPQSSDPIILEATATRLLFAATNPDTGRELWEIEVSAASD